MGDMKADMTGAAAVARGTLTGAELDLDVRIPALRETPPRQRIWTGERDIRHEKAFPRGMPPAPPNNAYGPGNVICAMKGLSVEACRPPPRIMAHDSDLFAHVCL